MFLLVCLTPRALFYALDMQVRGKKPGKQVNLSEQEIRALCLKSREIFISQPILLELEAPIKIVGKLFLMSFVRCVPILTGCTRSQVIFTDSTLTCFVCFNTVAFLRMPTICFLVIMWIGASRSVAVSSNLTPFCSPDLLL